MFTFGFFLLKKEESFCIIRDYSACFLFCFSQLFGCFLVKLYGQKFKYSFIGNYQVQLQYFISYRIVSAIESAPVFQLGQSHKYQFHMQTLILNKFFLQIFYYIHFSITKSFFCEYLVNNAIDLILKEFQFLKIGNF